MIIYEGDIVLPPPYAHDWGRSPQVGMHFCTETRHEQLLTLSTDDLSCQLCMLTQVADEWHAIVNKLHAFHSTTLEEHLDCVRGNMP